jgi:S1-C subfamily serine protease
MRLRRRGRAALAALLTVASVSAATPPVVRPLHAEIARLQAEAGENRLARRGLAFVRHESGSLRVDEKRSFEIELRRGDRLLAVGVCDEGCGDLDLALMDPRGERWFVDERSGEFPVVGGPIARSGPHTLTVDMVGCRERCHFAVEIRVSRLGAEAEERNRLDEALQMYGALVAPILRSFASEGRSLVRIEGFEQPSLGGGRQESFPVELPRAGRVLFAAACDYGCEDVDLFVEDASGAPVAQDQTRSAEPQLWFDAPAAGTYRVSVRMEHCLDEPCAYVAAVLAEAPLAPVFWSSDGRGSCFAVHSEGLVVTAAHIVSPAGSLRVHLSDGRELAAELHAYDAESDLAVLRLPEPTPAYLPLARSESATLGQRVFTLGFPVPGLLGADPKFSDGVIAGLAGSSFDPKSLQITVPIQPGSSGGPLVTEEGHVLGVVTGFANPDFFRAVSGSLPQGVNYAVRSEFLTPLLPSLDDSPPATDRAQAIERARAAACWVEVIRGGHASNGSSDEPISRMPGDRV